MGFIDQIPSSLHAAQQRLKCLSASYLEGGTVSRLPDSFHSSIGPKGELEADVTRVMHPKAFGWLTKIVATADAQSAKIIGLAGHRRGVGVTLVSRQLAASFAAFGRKTLLVDASRAVFGSFDDDFSSEPAALLELVTAAGENVSFVDLAAEPFLSAVEHGQLRTMCEAATERGYTVVVDLPPMVEPSGRPKPAFATAAPACEICLLICQSGSVTTSEINNCVDTSRIVGANLVGLVLNDWKLPGGRLLES